MVESFWKKWTRDYFPTLITRKRWNVERRNVLVGDMVLIEDTRAKRGVWKIGIVKDVKVSGDVRVRRAVVMYKNISESQPASQYQGTPYVEVDRPVHNLIVLVPQMMSKMLEIMIPPEVIILKTIRLKVTIQKMIILQLSMIKILKYSKMLGAGAGGVYCLLYRN